MYHNIHGKSNLPKRSSIGQLHALLCKEGISQLLSHVQKKSQLFGTTPFFSLQCHRFGLTPFFKHTCGPRPDYRVTLSRLQIYTMRHGQAGGPGRQLEVMWVGWLTVGPGPGQAVPSLYWRPLSRLRYAFQRSQALQVRFNLNWRANRRGP